SKIVNSDVGSDAEGVSDTIFGDDNDNFDGNQVKEKSGDQEGSYDPFNIYSLLNKQDVGNKGDFTNPSSDKSMSHPPGFTPENVTHANFNQETLHSSNQNVDHVNLGPNSEMSKSPLGDLNSRVVEDNQYVDDYSSPVTSNNPKAGRTGGSILDLLDDMITVGNTMGYSLDGCAADLEKIISLQGERDVFQ
ncbi:hypothetical protein Tco_0515429, partial [Tanacetum coccineum]